MKKEELQELSSSSFNYVPMFYNGGNVYPQSIQKDSFSINPYEQINRDIPKQGIQAGLSINYTPSFLNANIGYDSLTGSSNWSIEKQIPFLEKYHLGIGASGYNSNYGTQQGAQNAYATSPYLSVGYNNFNQNGSGVNAGINYTYGKNPQFNISYQRRF